MMLTVSASGHWFVGRLAPAAGIVAGLLCSSLAVAQPGQQGFGPGLAWEIVGDAVAARDKDLSGAACASDGTCLLVSDEKTRSWLFKLDRSDPTAPKLRITGQLNLSPAAAGKEADLEAAGFDSTYFYAIGSHGVSRRDNEYQPSRFSVYRITLDGRSEASGALTAQLASHPAIASHLCTAGAGTCRSLQDGGVNIEGMAVRDGLMYIGLRAPLNVAGNAIVLTTPIASLFDGAATKLELFDIKLGVDAFNRGLGIRDIAPVSKGFLVLAGPSLPEGKQPGSGYLFYWPSGQPEPLRLGPIGEPALDVKPEGLLLLQEDQLSWTVLILHDGIEGGRPREYRVAKP